MLGDTVLNLNSFVISPVTFTSMYKPHQKDWLSALVTAGLGAGIITTFAVSQGQSPWMGMGITLFAAIAAVLLEQIM